MQGTEKFQKQINDKAVVWGVPEVWIGEDFAVFNLPTLQTANNFIKTNPSNAVDFHIYQQNTTVVFERKL